MALEVGKKAPAFSLPDEDGRTRKLSDYKGKKLVVFFYPKANTSG
jgi:thioredoxin-dependent peroxiredoxin